MTSGIPLSDEEKLYIDTHLEDGPGHIAYQLGMKFKDKNGGHRSSRTVRQYIYRNLRNGVGNGVARISVRVPRWVILAAERKGLSQKDLCETAEQAIKGKVKDSPL